MKTPPELNIQIIQHLSDDLQSLRNCSLTCLHWSEIARPLKFYEVTFQYVEDLSRFRALVDEDPRLSDLVKAVHIRTPNAYAHPLLLGFSGEGDRREVASAPLAGMTALYPVLANPSMDLEFPDSNFDNGDTDGEATGIVTDMFHVLRKATKLSLSLCRVEDIRLADIVESLPNLQHLELLWCDVFRGVTHRRPLSPRPQLRKLLLHTPGVTAGLTRMPGVHDLLGVVLDWKLSSGIQSLDLYSYSTSTIAPGVVLTQASPSLIELRLDLTCAIDYRLQEGEEALYTVS